MNCHKFFDLKDLFNIKDNNGIPRCDKCNGLVKPDVVLYEESLNYDNITSAIDYISKADTLIVVGTSLVVYPAAGFVSYFKGKNLVLLNKSETAMSLNTTLAIHDDIKNIIEELKKL
jgi:NAD-dependent deacetylase